MKKFFYLFFYRACVFAQVHVELPHTFIEISDPLTEQIICSKGFSRLKLVHQYGVSAINQIEEPYSRYDHCLGVRALLEKANVSYEEKLSGLLHDASHTAFSHFGDYYFQSHGEDAWQDINHNHLLGLLGLKDLIESHNIKLDSIYHKNKSFTALDQPLPHLCADRLDYNLQGSLRHHLLTQDEAKAIFQDAQYQDGCWSLSDIQLAKKLSMCSITMMEKIWSCPLGHVSNLVLCKIMQKAIDLHLISIRDLCVQDDLMILNLLKSSSNYFIQQGLQLLLKLPSLVKDGTTFVIPYKCRALDPDIRTPEGYIKLTSLDNDYKNNFDQSQERAKHGMTFHIDHEVLSEYKQYFDELIATES